MVLLPPIKKNSAPAGQLPAPYPARQREVVLPPAVAEAVDRLAKARPKDSTTDDGALGARRLKLRHVPARGLAGAATPIPTAAGPRGGGRGRGGERPSQLFKLFVLSALVFSLLWAATSLLHQGQSPGGGGEFLTGALCWYGGRMGLGFKCYVPASLSVTGWLVFSFPFRTGGKCVADIKSECVVRDEDTVFDRSFRGLCLWWCFCREMQNMSWDGRS